MGRENKMGRITAYVTLDAVQRASLEITKGSSIMAFLTGIYGYVNGDVGRAFDLLANTVGTNPAVLACAVFALVFIFGGMQLLFIAIRIVVVAAGLSAPAIRRLIRRPCNGSN